MLLEALGVNRAVLNVHKVAALAVGVAEHGVHRVDAVFNRRVGIINDDAESGIVELGNIGLAGVLGLAGVARGIRIDVNLTAFNVATILIAPELFLNALNHRRRVVDLHQLTNSARQAITLYVNNRGHFPYVEVHTDKQRIPILNLVRTVVQFTVKGVVNGPTVEVGELPAQVCLNQFIRIRTQQRGNVIRGQVLRFVERAGLYQTVQSRKLGLFTHRLHELLVDEFEAFRRCGDIDAVTQPIDLVTHTGYDFSPCLLRFSCRHDVQLINHRVTDFKADYRTWLFHRAADCCPAVPPPLVKVNLFVPLVDFNA